MCSTRWYSKSRDVENEAAYALALSGDSSRSQMLAEDLSRRFPEDTIVRFTYEPTIRGPFVVELQPSKVVELLQSQFLMKEELQSRAPLNFIRSG